MTTTCTELVVSVIGQPAPQGSKSYKGRGRSGRPILVESSQSVKPWRAAAAWTAAAAARTTGWRAADVPIEVEARFYLPRPVTAAQRRVWPAVRPDLDKLLRSTLVALTDAAVITDDSRVVCITAAKYYAGPQRPQPGAVITIRKVDLS